MKTEFCICPACYRETLTEVVGIRGAYWRCLNRECKRTFLPEDLLSASADLAVDIKDTVRTADQLETSKKYRIPTTTAGQIYELRRMFRL